MAEELSMSVSQVFTGKSGEKYAFVYFTDEERSAEGKIPDCVIVTNNGFTSDEEKKLEEYMKNNLATLKNMSGGINVMSAFMKDKK